MSKVSGLGVMRIASGRGTLECGEEGCRLARLHVHMGDVDPVAVGGSEVEVEGTTLGEDRERETVRPGVDFSPAPGRS